jgi:hypothetical protein
MDGQFGLFRNKGHKKFGLDSAVCGLYLFDTDCMLRASGFWARAQKGVLAPVAFLQE